MPGLQVWSIRVSGMGSWVLGSGNLLRTPAGRCSQRRLWCVIKADDDYTHLHAFFVPLQEARRPTDPAFGSCSLTVFGLCSLGSPSSEAPMQLATRRHRHRHSRRLRLRLVACIIIMRMRAVGHII